MVIGPKSALNLHKVLVDTTVQAPMTYFERTDTSVILNRFSQDMSLVDMALPSATLAFLLGTYHQRHIWDPIIN
jgi:ATP-binding cassette subfamily C (CFTR/MRP) protein 1